MKKTLAILAIAITVASCNKSAEQAQFKTAYVDTEKMMKESVEAKDLEAKYKSKEEELTGQIKPEIERFQKELAEFQQKAKLQGELWARQNSGPLQQKQQQLQYIQEGMARQLQEESGKELDSLVVKVKKFMKTYGKEKGYDYVFATGTATTILFAKDQYDITAEATKAMNEAYAKEGKKETPAADEAKAEAKPAEKK